MDEYDYKKFVVSKHNHFNDKTTITSKGLENDPWAWHMKYIQLSSVDGLYLVGYIYATSAIYQMYHQQDKYWWCRHYQWRPFWGELTRNHALLIRDLRDYWFQRWLKEQEEKRKIILSASRLPEVLVNEIVDSIPYMYQTKRV